MSENGRYVEELGVAFAMHCDMSGLTNEQGCELAERIADALLWIAEDREGVTPLRDGHDVP
jgi:hypothetical protein